MISRLTLVSLAYLKNYYQWWLWSMYWVEFVLQFFCFIIEKVGLNRLADQTSFLSLHEFGQRYSWLGFWHVLPTLNTRILRILRNVSRQASLLMAVRFWTGIWALGLPACDKHYSPGDHYSPRDPISWFFYFHPRAYFFGIFFYKIGIYNPNLALRTLIRAITQWEGVLTYDPFSAT
jgi:hypothetical protein